jgi:hypothetical protein
MANPNLARLIDDQRISSLEEQLWNSNYSVLVTV